MKLLVGLGNPEQKYFKNRHNIGFIATDKIAEYYKLSSKKKSFQRFNTRRYTNDRNRGISLYNTNNEIFR